MSYMARELVRIRIKGKIMRDKKHRAAILLGTLVVALSTLPNYSDNVTSTLNRGSEGARVENEGDDGNAKNEKLLGLKLQPQFTVDDNTLKPRITLHTRTNSLFTIKKTNSDEEAFFDNYFLFKFTANAGINVSDFENPLESSEKIISEYIADGGNIDFDLSYIVSYKNFDFSIGPYYSLISTDAISTEQDTSTILSVDAEVYGANAYLSYDFNAIRLFGRYRTIETTDDGQNADFISILDNGHATEFGISLPMSVLAGSEGDSKQSPFFLTLSRTKHSEVDKAIFRVSVQKRFDL